LPHWFRRFRRTGSAVEPALAEHEKAEKEIAMSIRRIEVGPRMSQAVIHGNTVYLAGQVGTPGKSVAEQTKDVLASVDRLLKEAGSDKSKILQAIIWLADMADFAEMNSVWDKWVDGPNAPARATGEAKLATPEYKVEIIITAAV
jgi:enamine deaminase RidA (YjgF/YER057c/UK114 family)